MPPTSSHPTPDPRDPSRGLSDESASDEVQEMTEEEAKAVKTFSFQVSAGQKPNTKTLLRSDTQTPPAGPRRQREESLADPNFTPLAETPSSQLPTAAAVTSTARHPATRRASRKMTVAPARTLQRKRRGFPPSTISLALHGCLLVLLSIYTLVPPPQEEKLNFSTSTVAYEEIEEFQDLEIDPSEALEALDSELAAELSDPGAASFGDLSAESALADVAGDTALGDDSIGQLGNLLGDTGSGLADVGDSLGAAATASFFGTQVEGRRILYLLDNSGGMKGGKLETLIDELLKSVSSLQPQQEFYVIFYSDTIYPLFYPQPATDFVRATPKNREYLQAWLKRVELRTGNKIDAALEAAV
ncbi:MAG: hypothetical protein MI725_10245, partial [Pirellulales bacterium]|nr:hypothetical protein [Pirellulales bacterium]